jgi:hypothetical protein
MRQGYATLHGSGDAGYEVQYKPHGATPIKLQSHNDPSEPISFRNIWVREL